MTTEEKCKNLYSGNLWVKFFANIRFWTGSFSEIEKYVPKQGNILDLGCGYGIFSNFLAISSSKRRIIGVDTDGHKILFADRGIKTVSFRKGDATKMKIPNLSAILIHDVLHHLDSYQEQENLIKKCREMLKTGGVLLIVEVDNKPFWKLILGRITDFIMYKGTPVYYRYRREMIILLQSYFSEKSIKYTLLLHNPFPQVLYICKKT